MTLKIAQSRYDYLLARQKEGSEFYTRIRSAYRFLQGEIERGSASEEQQISFLNHLENEIINHEFSDYCHDVEMDETPVLFLGGSLDGQYLKMADRRHWIYQQIPPLQVAQEVVEESIEIVIERETYIRERLAIGHELRMYFVFRFQK